MFAKEKQDKTQFVYKYPSAPLEKGRKKWYYFMLRKYDPEDTL